MINYSKFVENSRKWLANYIKANHLQSCVLGISGGIDSTVSACLAFPVCKELNIPLIGRSLPCMTNKECELHTANLVGNAFCTNYKECNIQLMYETCLDELQLYEGQINSLQKGNIKARLRMIYLYNLAHIHKGVVLDNDNFTEWNLGFWTVGGDSPMDINLGLHYLWKTEIYELANYLVDDFRLTLLGCGNSPEEEVTYSLQLRAILKSINLTPTDGNGVSNSDCEQFGLDNYEQVDDVLKTMYYNKGYSIMIHNDKIMNKTSEFLDKEYIRLVDSYNKQGVDKVMMLHQNTVYKRKELPIKPTKEELGL